MMLATFKAHQGSDRDRLIDRLVACKDWSHIGAVKCSNEPNHIEVTAFFTGHTSRARKACFAAQVLNNWKLTEII